MDDDNDQPASDRHKLVQAYYDARAERYDYTWHPRYIRKLMEFIPPSVFHSKSKCLDLCCGTGLLTFLLAQRVPPGGRVFGLDISEGMLDVAKAKLISASLVVQRSVNLRNCAVDSELSSTAPELASWRGCTDLIACASSLVFLADPAAAVQMWTTYLAPGTGRLVVDVPHEQNLRNGLVLETVADRMGSYIPFRRGWVTSRDGFMEWIKRVTGGELLVERCELVQQDGYSSRVYKGGLLEAEVIFERTISSMTFKELRRNQELREHARKEFVKEWLDIALREDGVHEVDGAWLAVCRRR